VCAHYDYFVSRAYDFYLRKYHAQSRLSLAKLLRRISLRIYKYIFRTLKKFLTCTCRYKSRCGSRARTFPRVYIITYYALSYISESIRLLCLFTTRKNVYILNSRARRGQSTNGFVSSRAITSGFVARKTFATLYRPQTRISIRLFPV